MPNPSDTPTPPHLTVFDATEDELIDELKRRNDGIVVVRERRSLGRVNPADYTNVFLVDWRGGLSLVIGLVARANARLLVHANNPQTPPPDPSGDGQVSGD